MKKALKFLDDNLESMMLVALLAAISIVMFVQIIMRFLFNSALPWPEEFCRICFVYSGFICFGYCQKRHSGIKIDVLVNLMPKGLQNFINVLGEVLLFVFYVFLLYESIDLMNVTIANGSVTSALQLPLYVEYFALPLGVGLATFRSVEQFVRFLLKRGKGGDEA